MRSVCTAGHVNAPYIVTLTGRRTLQVQDGKLQVLEQWVDIDDHAGRRCQQPVDPPPHMESDVCNMSVSITII